MQSVLCSRDITERSRALELGHAGLKFVSPTDSQGNFCYGGGSYWGTDYRRGDISRSSRTT